MSKELVFVSYDIFGDPIILKDSDEQEDLIKIEKKKKLSPYDFITCICNKKIITDEMKLQINTSSYPRYIIDNWIGSSRFYIKLICDLQENNMDNMSHFTSLYRTVKKGSYIPLLFKKQKNEVSKELEAIIFYFRCKPTIAKKYIKILSTEDIKELIEWCKYNKKIRKDIKKTNKSFEF